MEDHGLLYFKFKEGHVYTWNNKRGGLANIQERLDKGIANEEWKLMFPDAKITHLAALNSDHKLFLLKTNPSSKPSMTIQVRIYVDWPP